MKKLSILIFAITIIFSSCQNSGNDEKKSGNDNDLNTEVLNKNNKSENANQAPSDQRPAPSGKGYKKFKIEGTVINGANVEVTLDKLGIADIYPQEATAANEQGYFEFTGSLKEPGLYQLRFAHGAIHLILTGGTVELKANIDHISRDYEVRGSEDSKMLKELYLLINDFNAEKEKLQERLNKAPNRKKTQLIDSIPLLQKEIEKRKSEALKDFISRADSSLVVLLAANYLDASMNTAYLDQLLKKMKPYHEDQVFYSSIEKKVAYYAPFSVGKEVPDISLPNVDGKVITLSDLKGKYVLLDFWASWCKPCRREHPELKKIYNHYNNRGFEIYSVSLDDNRANWLKAIKEDGIPWIQVSDVQGWQSPVAQEYNIEAIPATFLLDPEGKIIAKDLRALELKEKLRNLIM